MLAPSEEKANDIGVNMNSIFPDSNRLDLTDYVVTIAVASTRLLNCSSMSNAKFTSILIALNMAFTDTYHKLRTYLYKEAI